MDSKDRHLTTKQAAELLNVSELTLWRLRRTGRLASFKVGSRVRFRRSDLERFIARQLAAEAERSGRIDEMNGVAFDGSELRFVI